MANDITNPVPTTTRVEISNGPDYRNNYANSVQARVTVWDFFLVFGKGTQVAPDAMSIQNFQGVYLSPQQAKALSNVLTHNVQQYEAAFGEIKLAPHPGKGQMQ